MYYAFYIGELFFSLSYASAVWSLYQSLPPEPGTGKPSKKRTVQLVQSRGCSNFSRTVLQRMERRAERAGFFAACDGRDVNATAASADGARAGSAESSAAPLFSKVKRGRKVNEQFETDVIGKLLYVTIVSVRDTVRRKAIPLSSNDSRIRAKIDAAKEAEKGRFCMNRVVSDCCSHLYSCYSVVAGNFLAILNNITHSYGVIRRAAQETKKEWLKTAASNGISCDPTVAKCKFSDKWIRNFLDRFNLTRQRITATIKSGRPLDAEVQEIMAALQAEITKHGFETCDVL